MNWPAETLAAVMEGIVPQSHWTAQWRQSESGWLLSIKNTGTKSEKLPNIQITSSHALPLREEISFYEAKAGFRAQPLNLGLAVGPRSNEIHPPGSEKSVIWAIIRHPGDPSERLILALNERTIGISPRL